MTTQEALSEIRARGFDLSYWQLRGLVTRGETPAHRLSSSKAWDWTAADVDNVVAALQERDKANTSA